MANPTTNYGWQMPTPTDLVTDLPADFEVFGQAVDTSLLGLKGGTTGQVLSKTSGTDMAFTWATDASGIPATIVDAKGDIIAATAADTVSRLAVGANNTVLTADSTAATGMKWAAGAGGGKVLQVVTASTSTGVTITSTTFTDTGLTATITPTLSSSRVLVLTTQPMYVGALSSTTELDAKINLMRDATQVYLSTLGTAIGFTTSSGSWFLGAHCNISYLDSPATTSATTYKTQSAPIAGANSLSQFQRNGTSTSVMILLEIGA